VQGAGKCIINCAAIKVTKINESKGEMKPCNATTTQQSTNEWGRREGDERGREKKLCYAIATQQSTD